LDASCCRSDRVAQADVRHRRQPFGLERESELSCRRARSGRARSGRAFADRSTYYARGCSNHHRSPGMCCRWLGAR
jgi:hypothetical protein